MPETKPVRWSDHALRSIASREIDREEAERTLAEPESVAPGGPSRQVLMRRYFDEALRQEMLLRIVVEDTTSGRIVVTAYRTSRIEKYLKGPGP